MIDAIEHYQFISDDERTIVGLFPKVILPLPMSYWGSDPNKINLLVSVLFTDFQCLFGLI